MRASRGPMRPVIRLRRVPPLDPPFDDEADPQIWSITRGGRQLMLDVTPGARWARRSSPLAGPRPGGSAGSQPAGPAGIGPGGRRPGAALPPPAASPQAQQAARRFLTICLEVLNGFRPLAHIHKLSEPAKAAKIAANLADGRNRMTPSRTPTRPDELIRVRRLRVCEPRPGVVEAAAALSAAGRTWAMAFRLERREQRWIGTAANLL